MKKIGILIGIVSIISTLLMGCSEAKEIPIEQKNTSEKEDEGDKLFTSKVAMLHIEDEINKELSYKYVFNGFIGDDTLSFEKQDGYRTYSSLHPTKIGHKFELKEIEGIQFEVIDFSREKGYVKLKISKAD